MTLGVGEGNGKVQFRTPSRILELLWLAIHNLKYYSGRNPLVMGFAPTKPLLSGRECLGKRTPDRIKSSQCSPDSPRVHRTQSGTQTRCLFCSVCVCVRGFWAGGREGKLQSHSASRAAVLLQLSWAAVAEVVVCAMSLVPFIQGRCCWEPALAVHEEQTALHSWQHSAA